MHNKYDYIISHSTGDKRKEINYDEVISSDIAPFYGENNRKIFERSSLFDLSQDNEKTIDGVYNQLSINNLVYLVNNFSLKYYGKRKNKSQSFAVLKSLFKGGTSSDNAYKSSYLLPWDIDVKNKVLENGTKKEENIALFYNKELNEKVFKYMESISLLTFRSSSGLGMAGFIVVPILEKNFILKDRREHIDIGNAVNRYINESLDLPVEIEFDKAQNKFRQIRYIPAQKKRLEINKNYVEFNVERIKIENKSLSKTSNDKKVSSNRNSNTSYNVTSNTIETFNSSNLCEDLITEHYELISSNQKTSRYNKRSGDSNAMIIYHETNTFHDFKNEIKGSSPFDLYMYFRFDGDFKKSINSLKKNSLTTDEFDKIIYTSLDSPFFAFLRKIGVYKHDEEHKEALNNIANFSHDANLTPFDKEIILINYMRNNAYYYDIEKLLKDESITTSLLLEKKNFVNPNWVIENLNKTINVLSAGCGTGKTFSFLAHDNAIAKQKKTLYVLPRTILVHQQANEFNQDYKIFACASGDCNPISKNVRFFNSINSNLIKLFDEDKLNETKIQRIKDFKVNDTLDEMDFKNALISGIITYDQFASLPVKIIELYEIIALDESHTLSSDSSFRFNQIEQSFKNIDILARKKNDIKFVFITATNGIETSVFHHRYKEDFKILNVSKKYDINPKIKVVNIEDKNHKNLIFKQLISSVNKKRKVIVLINSRKEIKKIWSQFNDFCKENNVPTPNMASISSKDKAQKVYTSITVNETLGDVEILFCTSIMEAGVNIKINDGIDFIFDYSNELYHTDAKGALQLIYRNRNRNSKVYCFVKAFDKQNKKLITNLENNNYSIDEIIKSSVFDNQLEKHRSLKGLNIEDYKLKNAVIFNNTALINDYLTERFKGVEKHISTFLILANQQNCEVTFDFEREFTHKSIILYNTNEFVINVLKNVLKLNLNLDVDIQPVADEDFNTSTITNEFNLLSHEIIENKVHIKAKYHSMHQFVIFDLTYFFNYLRRFYWDDLETTFNFILDNRKNKNQFKESISDYISTHKALSNNKEALSYKLIKGISVEEGADSTIEVLKLRENLVKEFQDVLITERDKAGNDLNQLITNTYLKEDLPLIINKIIDGRIKDLFVKRRKGESVNFSRKYILENSNSDKNKEVDDDFSYLIQALSASKNNTDKFENDSLNKVFNKIIKDEEKQKTDKLEAILQLHKLKIIKTNIFANENIEIRTSKDYFSASTYRERKTVTEVYIYNTYKKELQEFHNIPSNKRSKNCFILINLENDSIIIQKSRKIMFEHLLEKGILKEFLSFDRKDFTKKTIFDKHMDLCENYLLKSIPIVQRNS